MVAALALTLPLQSQQSAIRDSTEASGSASQPASAGSKRAQQVEQDQTAAKTWIELPAEESPMDPSTIALDDGPPAVPSSNPGNPDPQQTPPAPSGQSPALNSDHALTGNFFHRLAQFYSQDWTGTNPAGPSVTKRGLPAAENSPPFPFSDWGHGGSPDIGAPDGNTYPLMSALGLENSRNENLGTAVMELQPRKNYRRQSGDAANNLQCYSSRLNLMVHGKADYTMEQTGSGETQCGVTHHSRTSGESAPGDSTPTA